MGTADFVADPITVVSSLPEAVQQNGDAMRDGAVAMANGEVASGSSQFLDGAIGDVTLAMVTGGAMHGLPKAYGAYLKGWQVLDQAALRATRNLRPLVPGMSTAQMGAIEVPAGYVRIPGGEFVDGPLKGQKIRDFYIMSRPLTNQQWQAGLCSLGRQRYASLWVVDGRFNVRFSTTPPAIDPHGLGYLDRGEVYYDSQYSQDVLLQDAPSAVYDSPARIFSGSEHPVVGVTRHHAMAWLLAQQKAAGGRLAFRLPTDIEIDWVVTDGGRLEYPPSYEAGLLPAPGDGPLTLDKFVTLPVTEAPDGPFGANVMNQVWLWTQDNPKAPWCSSGLRGGLAWRDPKEVTTMAGSRLSYDGFNRHFTVGFAPVLVSNK